MGLSTVPARALCICNINHLQRNCRVFSIINVNLVYERNQVSSVSYPLSLSLFQDPGNTAKFIAKLSFNHWRPGFAVVQHSLLLQLQSQSTPRNNHKQSLYAHLTCRGGDQGDKRSRKLFQIWTEKPLVQNEDTFARGEREQAKFGHRKTIPGTDLRQH